MEKSECKEICGSACKCGSTCKCSVVCGAAGVATVRKLAPNFVSGGYF